MNKIKVILIGLVLFTVSSVKAETTTVGITNTQGTRVTSSTSNRTSTTRRTTTDTDLEEKVTKYGYSENAIIKTNASSGYKYVVSDAAELLSDGEKEELLSTLELCSEFGNAGFFSVNEYASSPDAYASSLYHSLYGTSSGTIFVINMRIRKITVFSDGSNYSKITTNKAESIVSNVYRYASNENYFACANNAFKQVYQLLSGKTIFEPMKMVSNLFISITIATFICYIYILSTSKIKKAKDKELFSGINKDLMLSNINIVKTGTREVYNPPSDSGGSSGGGGGGGGSSGGGASHGF